jgi:hypothetical protein
MRAILLPVANTAQPSLSHDCCQGLQEAVVALFQEQVVKPFSAVTSPSKSGAINRLDVIAGDTRGTLKQPVKHFASGSTHRFIESRRETPRS